LGVFRSVNKKVLLFLIPLGDAAAAAMSSGGTYDSIYGPVGLFMILTPLVYDLRKATVWGRNSILALFAIIGLAVVIGKILRPLMWNYYLAAPMFEDRVWINHPLYGSMYIEKDREKFFSSVCNVINAEGKKRMLLSLPYSFANYYCGIDPWNAYVQTFFDTSSSETIRKMMWELNGNPPMWILYQRQLKILKINEISYNHGHPLAHRDLDDLIESRLDSGAWKLVAKWTEQKHDDWLLIRTSPAAH
jgi:hypothetical protein